MRTVRAAAVAVLAAAAVAGAAGCTSQAAARPAGVAGSAPASASELTLTQARKIYDTFITTDDVASAAGDESLQLSLVGQAQAPLTVSAYERAGYANSPTPRYRYAAARLYVPQMRSYPFWFVAVAARTPAQGGPARTAIMVFSRPATADPWQLSLSTLLDPGTAMPQIALDAQGRATALATFDHGLVISPNSVGALQAAVADDGPAAASAPLLAAGPYTTGIHQQMISARRQVNSEGLTYASELQGTSYPLYALGTSDGGALVLYSLVRSATIARKHRASTPVIIPIPQAFAPILYATGDLIIRTGLSTGETYQYAAEVPASQPAGKPSALTRVIASDGGPTSASGT